MRRLISVDSIGQIIGLALIATALHKSYTHEGYDPLPQINLGIGVISGAYILPTKKIDEKLQQAVKPIDRDIV
jgi:hypothetical protein